MVMGLIVGQELWTILAGLTENDVLGLHCGKGNGSLQFADPDDRAVAEHNNVSSAAADAMGII